MYRGTDSDVAIEGALQTIKTGDSITIRKSDDQITPVTQNERIVAAITSRVPWEQTYILNKEYQIKSHP